MTPMTTFSAYEHAAAKTAIYPDAGYGTMTALAYVTLGLTNEAGEVAGKLKKVLRDGGGTLTEDARAVIAGEVADVLWYVAMAARELGTTLEALATENAAKLADRSERGVLGGSGDNR